MHYTVSNKKEQGKKEADKVVDVSESHYRESAGYSSSNSLV